MKNMRRKTILLSAALLLAASHTFAQVSTEVINGLSYKINARTHTATLVGDEDNPYTGNIVVPETVTAQDGTDYSVTAFGEECFLGCIDLESVKIPSTVTTLGARCFMNCQTITEIDLPEGLKELPVGCFASCASLKRIDVPASVTSVGGVCFMDCTDLSEVHLPATIKSLPAQCFSRCLSLMEMEIPSSVTTIGDYCFYRSSLSSIKIPYSVTTVGAHCFEKCSMLETVELASTVTQLNEGCFSYCSSLTSLYFNGNMPDNTIGCGAPNSCSLYVPEEYYDHYQEELGAVYRKIFTWTPNELTRIDQLAQRDPQVSSQGGVVTVSGLNRGEEVQFVGLDGRLFSSVQALDGTASCAVSVPVVIARVRGAAVKVVVR